MDVNTMEAWLKEPFNPQLVKWRITQKSNKTRKVKVAPYIDSRAIMARLDDVCGFMGWSDRINVSDGYVLCTITLSSADGNQIKEVEDGAGAPVIDFSNENDVKMSDMKKKGAISDAFKRAAVKLGVGRYLYEVPAVWVPMKNDYGDFDPPSLPDFALPGNVKKKPDTVMDKQFDEAESNWEQEPPPEPVRSYTPPASNTSAEPEPIRDDMQVDLGEIEFPRGKFSRQKIYDVTDKDYLKWWLTNNNPSPFVKQALENRIGVLEKKGFDNIRN